jgi:hypothetical protein
MAHVGPQRHKKENHNLMGPLSYVRSVVDRNVVMRRIPVFRSTILLCSNSRLYRLSSHKTTHSGGGGLGGRSTDHGGPGSVPAHFMFTSKSTKWH